MIFDTHAHYEDKSFDLDRDELLSSMKMNNVGTIVNVGSSLETSEKSLVLADIFEDVYAAVGIHPTEVGPKEDIVSTLEALKEMSTHRKCVAIGEIGLDFYWEKEPSVQDLQRLWFKKQLELVREVDMPVIIHSRDASKETFDILKDSDVKAVIHCYSGSAQMAREYVKMGDYIGVGGVVTFKNGRKLQETVKSIPIENILLETDAPYMAPEPNRGKRNDSIMIKYVAKKVAELKEMSVEDVVRITEENAKRFYNI